MKREKENIVQKIANILKNVPSEELRRLFERIRKKYEPKVLFCRKCEAELSTESERNRWDKKGERICDLCIAVWQADLGVRKAKRAHRKAQRLANDARKRAEQEAGEEDKRTLREEVRRLSREEAWLKKAYWLEVRYAKAVAAWRRASEKIKEKREEPGKKKVERKKEEKSSKREERAWKRTQKKEEQRRRKKAEARRKAQKKEGERRRREEKKAWKKAQREAEKVRRRAERETEQRAGIEEEEEAEELSEEVYREYYKALGLSEDATFQEIKGAYLKQVKRHHPDMGGDVQRFKKIQEAYEVLVRGIS